MFSDGVQYRKGVANAIAMYYIPCDIYSYVYFRSKSLYFKKVKKFSVKCEDLVTYGRVMESRVAVIVLSVKISLQVDESDHAVNGSLA